MLLLLLLLLLLLNTIFPNKTLLLAPARLGPSIFCCFLQHFVAPMLLKPWFRDEPPGGEVCCCSFPSWQLAVLASLKSLKFPLFLLIANEVRGSPAAAWNAVLRLVSSLPSMKRAPFSRGSLGLADGSFLSTAILYEIRTKCGSRFFFRSATRI